MFKVLLSTILVVTIWLQAPSAVPVPSANADTPEVMHIGGDVKPPVLIHSVDPKFSAAARAAIQGGNVRVYLWVNKQGLPTHVRVIKGVGMGLDEKAVEAVRQYRFKPATLNGEPVVIDLYIDVNFQIFKDR